MLRGVLPPLGPSVGVPDLEAPVHLLRSRHGKSATYKMGEGICPCLDINCGLNHPHQQRSWVR